MLNNIHDSWLGPQNRRSRHARSTITIHVSRAQDILSPNFINDASDARPDMRVNWNEWNEVMSNTVYAHLTVINNICSFSLENAS